MPVFSVWESHFPAEAAESGRQVTDAIWRDMPDFEGYVSHKLIEDLDDPGHMLVVSEWAPRERADASVHEYAGHPNVRRVNELLARPRARFVGRGVPPSSR